MPAGEAGAGRQRRTQAFDAAIFRQVIGNFMSGVVVLTTLDSGRRYGMTVSAVSSLSLDPPMLLTCLHGRSPTQEAVRRSGRFTFNILGEDQGHLAERFPGSHDDKFAGVEVSTGRTGVPLLSGALATVECRVVEVVSGGTHRVFLAAVEHAEAREGSPLAYFRGRFGRFEMAQDNAAYDRLRNLVLSREAGPGDRLDVQELSERLGLSPTSAYYALTRLVGDGLVARDQERGHVVTPLEVATSDDANDAKLAIELGAADLDRPARRAKSRTECAGPSAKAASIAATFSTTDRPSSAEPPDTLSPFHSQNEWKDACADLRPANRFRRVGTAPGYAALSPSPARATLPHAGHPPAVRGGRWRTRSWAGGRSWRRCGRTLTRLGPDARESCRCRAPPGWARRRSSTASCPPPRAAARCGTPPAAGQPASTSPPPPWSSRWSCTPWCRSTSPATTRTPNPPDRAGWTSTPHRPGRTHGRLPGVRPPRAPAGPRRAGVPGDPAAAGHVDRALHAAVGGTDAQHPHAADEVYVVLGGKAILRVEDELVEVREGSVVSVDRGRDHRFTDISEELHVLVVFAPPADPDT